ncbi:tyrosine-type recombinase/integrase [Aquitalea sp. USM4]|uniref:tyrosine-type recombinase/integrase n=1 Tax=Aquitalea sp. USM4 TaxID=1590041 RepID=UPI001A954754|nr:tyrosine-type recombinase/integrase [Aquitalea sp. USM4]
MPIRFMSAEEAAAYCGMDLEQFSRLVQPNIPLISIPSPAADTVPATRYDRHDIDAWCDGFKAAQSTKKPTKTAPGHTAPPKNTARERGLVKRGDIWHINKIYRGIPIRKSTHQTDRGEAERVLIQHLAAIDQGKDFGLRPKHHWKEAAAKYLAENQAMPSIQDAAMHLEALEPYIGHLPLEQIHDHTLQKFIAERKKRGKNVQAANGVSARTINMALELVGRILRKAAFKWRDELGLTWLDKCPAISKLKEENERRPPYPMSWEEQRLLLKALPYHLAIMALFKVNTGTREKEVCNLRWEWEVPIPELNTSVFLIPAKFGGRTPSSGVKNGKDRLVVLNAVARHVVDTQRGQDQVYVFAYSGKGHPAGIKNCLDRMNGHAWRKARNRAAEQYQEEHGRPANAGFAELRVHDLKHTFGHRLRVAGVPFEDRQSLLGHTSKSVTTHYSAPEIGRLIAMAERAQETDARQVAAPTILRR